MYVSESKSYDMSHCSLCTRKYYIIKPKTDNFRNYINDMESKYLCGNQLVPSLESLHQKLAYTTYWKSEIKVGINIYISSCFD